MEDGAWKTENRIFPSSRSSSLCSLCPLWQNLLLAEDVGQDGAALVDLVVVQGQGRQQTDDVAVGGIDQQPAPEIEVEPTAELVFGVG